MESELIFLEPAFKKTVWGGKRLRTAFGFERAQDGDGECWLISAHPAGDCAVASGRYAGMKLSELWNAHRDIFGGGEGEFPLLIKLINTASDLSVQVHPDNAYAREHENSFGKTECWYVLESRPNADIVLGHNAETPAELRSMAEEGRWTELLRRRPVHKGDFFQIEPGTIHALGGGVTVLETQQSSDVTYRLYDYGRLEDGKPRTLHTERALDVAVCPYVPAECETETVSGDGFTRERLVSCEFYTVEKITVSSEAKLSWPDFAAVAVIDGAGFADGTEIKKGAAFIVPHRYGLVGFKGDMTLIVSRRAALYVGIDLGGTNIAAGLTDERGRIIRKASAPTLPQRPVDEIADDMAELCRSVAGESFAAVRAVGVGCPGTVDAAAGVVRYSNNIPMRDVPLAAMLRGRLGRPVTLENDANAAALGEQSVGGESSLVLITLGTGVGGGGVFGGELYRGFNGAGFEPGHIIIDPDGPLCTCGNRGCWEAMASASALVRMTREAMDGPNGLALRVEAEKNGLDGRTAFVCAARGDAAAKDVVNAYIRNVGLGLVSLVNLLQPAVIAVGGGISNQGTDFFGPLIDFVRARDFNKYCARTEIRPARLLGDAGITGAALCALR